MQLTPSTLVNKRRPYLIRVMRASYGMIIGHSWVGIDDPGLCKGMMRIPEDHFRSPDYE